MNHKQVVEYHTLGLQELKKQNLNNACAYFQQAIALDDTYVKSYQCLGDAYMQLGEFEEAKAAYKQVINLTQHADGYYAYGNACFMNGEDEEALHYFHEAIMEGYEQEDLVFFMAEAHEKRKEEAQALQCYRQACIQNPSKLAYRMKLIFFLIEIGQEASALDEIKRAKALTIDTKEEKQLLLCQARIYLKKGELSKAKACLKQCLDFNQ